MLMPTARVKSWGRHGKREHRFCRISLLILNYLIYKKGRLLMHIMIERQ